MTGEAKGISRLFLNNCHSVLQDIFLYLDPGSLHRARQVSHQWNHFITDLVWGSRRGYKALERRLHHLWLRGEPEMFGVDYTEQMFIHRNTSALAMDDRSLVVGLSELGEGGAKVIDLTSREPVAHLPHQDHLDRGVGTVMITKTWLITGGEEKVILWDRNTFEQVRVLNVRWRNRSNFCVAESEEQELFLSVTNDFSEPNLFLYRLSPRLDIPEKIIFKKENVIQTKFCEHFSNHKMIGILCYNGQKNENSQFHIQEIHQDEVRTRSIIEHEYGINGVWSMENLIETFSLTSHYLILLLHPLVLTVYNIDTSSKMYSIQVDSSSDNVFPIGMQLEHKLLKISTPDKIYVLNAENLEDENLVLKSKREIRMTNVEGYILFSKWMGVYRHQDTITFINFWK